MGKDRKIETGTAADPADTAPAAAPFALDVAEYRDDLAEFNLTEDQQRVFLETLWSILSTFVDYGFRVDVCSILFRDFQDVSRGGEIEVGSLPSSATGANAIQKGNGAS